MLVDIRKIKIKEETDSSRYQKYEYRLNTQAKRHDYYEKHGYN